MKLTFGGALILAALSLMSADIWKAPAARAAATSSAPISDQERVEKNKQTILSRLKRDKVTYRGDKPGQIRIRWEWYDTVVRNYIFEKRILLRELSANEKHSLRPEWVYKDMKVTFEELFQLGPEDDDKLLPILSHQSLLDMVPKASLEGLTLLGKQGELKGEILRKYKVRTIYFDIYTNRLEYKNSSGKAEMAFGIASDAFTLRWKDIKNRLVEDISEAKQLEDLRLERDALFPDESPAKQ
jgi:hypothetical protein